MRILGLDPGSRHTGYGVVERRGAKLRALACGRLSSSANTPLPTRLAALVSQLRPLLDRFEPAVVALETPFHGINSRSLIVLAQARGALLAEVAGRRLEVREYSPAQVKSAVSGSGRADKEQVAKMVRMILSLSAAGFSSDETDALAVAICCAQSRPLEAALERG